MIADSEQRTVRPRTCYICHGTKIVPVAQWNKEKEVFYENSTCPRCAGKGAITGPPFIDDVIARPIIVRSEPPCICFFPIDGPTGNPLCPAR